MTDAEAELGWKMLDTLLRSTLATKDDSDIVQVIAEHAALGVNGEDEHGDTTEAIGGPQEPGT